MKAVPMSATLIHDLPQPASLPGRTSPATGPAPGDTEDVVTLVLQMLRERMEMDVVFVTRGAELPAGRAEVPLSIPIVLRDGRIHGLLCCYSPASGSVAERDLRSLRYSARLAARLLDNLQILRDLSRQSVRH